MSSKFWDAVNWGSVFVATYLTTHYLERIAGFHYNVLSEPVNIGKLAMDLSLWIVIFCGYRLALRKVVQIRQQSNLPGAARVSD